MAIKESGSLSLEGDIVAEFGPTPPGSRPHNISEYYRDGDNVPDGPPANTDIPTVSTPRVSVSFSDYYGATSDQIPSGSPTVSSTRRVGDDVIVNVNGVSDADGIADTNWQVRFLVNGSAVTGYTSATRFGNGNLSETYQITSSNVANGDSISAQIGFTDNIGNSYSGITASNSVTAINTASTGSVTISTPLSGNPGYVSTTSAATLTANTSGISDRDGLRATTPFTYQWLRNGNALAGETGSTYTVKSTDVGQNISVSVVAYDIHDATTSFTSSSVTPLRPVVRFTTDIPSEVNEGETITVPAGSIEIENLPVNLTGDRLRVTTSINDSWILNGAIDVYRSITWAWVAADGVYKNTNEITITTTRDDSTLSNDSFITLFVEVDGLTQLSSGKKDITVRNLAPLPNLPTSISESAGGDPTSVFVAVRFFGNGEIRTIETGSQVATLKGTWVPIRDYNIAYRVRLTNVTTNEGISGNLSRTNPVDDGQYIALPTTATGFVEWRIDVSRIEPDPGSGSLSATVQVNQTGTTNSDTCSLTLTGNTSNTTTTTSTGGGTTSGGTGVRNPDGPPPDGGEFQ